MIAPKIGPAAATSTQLSSDAGAGVSVCIVSWNSAADIRACLEAVARQDSPVSEVIIVDNGSSDESVEWASLQAPDAIVLRRSSNDGFCRAMNQAIDRSSGEFIVTLNPDCRLEPSFVREAIEALRADPGIGSIAGMLLRLDGTNPSPSGARTIDSAGLVLTPARRVMNQSEGERWTKRHSQPLDVFGACAAAGVYRRIALDSVRGVDGTVFDESFFAYKEDADLAWRLARAGWRCAHVPAAVAFHRRGWRLGSRNAVSPECRMRSLRNRWLLIAKNEPAGSLVLRLPWLVTNELAILAFALVREPFLLRAYPNGLRVAAEALWRRGSGRAVGSSRQPERAIVRMQRDEMEA